MIVVHSFEQQLEKGFIYGNFPVSFQIFLRLRPGEAERVHSH